MRGFRASTGRSRLSTGIFQLFSISAFQRFSVSAFQRFSFSAFVLKGPQPPKPPPNRGERPCRPGSPEDEGRCAQSTQNPFAPRFIHHQSSILMNGPTLGVRAPRLQRPPPPPEMDGFICPRALVCGRAPACLVLGTAADGRRDRRRLR